MGYGSFAPGNAEGGLTTHRGEVDGRLRQVRRRADPRPDQARRRSRRAAGSTCSTSCPTATPRCGFPNINDNAEIAELIACGVARRAVHHRPRLGGRLGDLARSSRSAPTPRPTADERRHGRGRRPHPRGRGTASTRWRARSSTSCSTWPRRPPDGQRGPRPPGVHPHLQVDRADRPLVPADGR